MRDFSEHIDYSDLLAASLRDARAKNGRDDPNGTQGALFPDGCPSASAGPGRESSQGAIKHAAAAARLNALDPAFPIQALNGSGDPMLGVSWGMSKREQIAAMAMQGLCANSIAGSHHNPDRLAREAVGLADELLLQLAREPL